MTREEEKLPFHLGLLHLSLLKEEGSSQIALTSADSGKEGNGEDMKTKVQSQHPPCKT